MAQWQNHALTLPPLLTARWRVIKVFTSDSDPRNIAQVFTMRISTPAIATCRWVVVAPLIQAASSSGVRLSRLTDTAAAAVTIALINRTPPRPIVRASPKLLPTANGSSNGVRARLDHRQDVHREKRRRDATATIS